MSLKNILLATALLTGSLQVAADDHAHGQAAGHLTIERPWSREMPPVAPTAAAYFVVHNKGAADRLLEVRTPIADKAEFHEHVQVDDGVMKMQQVQAVEIPAGGKVQFEPMGYHVMLFGVRQQAKDGERFPLTLTFEKAGVIELDVAVQKEPPAAEYAH